MGHHEASTTVDVAANILFDYVSDLDNLPDYLPRLAGIHRRAPRPDEAQGLEVRRPKEPVHEEVEVAATVPSGQTVHSEAWIDIVEEDRKLRWGAPGDSDYHGELDVDFVADGTSRLTVRLDTEHDTVDVINSQLHEALESIKTKLEQAPRSSDETAEA
jgi:hypothetical protein